MNKKLILVECAYCGWQNRHPIPKKYDPRKPIQIIITCESCGREDGIREVSNGTKV